MNPVFPGRATCSMALRSTEQAIYVTENLARFVGDAGDRHGPLPLRPLWCVLLGQALLDTQDVILSVPARRAIIVAPGRQAPPDAWAAGDDTPPRIPGASRGSAIPGAKQTGCGKRPPRRCLGLRGAANRRGSDTRLTSHSRTWPVTARRTPTAAPASWGVPLST
jgi:hypothetical protein